MTYIMDDPREGERLIAKVADIDAWVETYYAAPLEGARSFLCVGCGPGHFIEAVARRFPAIALGGVDLSAERLRDAALRLRDVAKVSLMRAEAGALPIEDGSYDVVASRFLLEYLDDPGRAIREMRRVLRPGGRLLLQDLDGQLVWHWPEDAELVAFLERVIGSLRTTGFDPFIGRKLFGLCRAAGFADVTVRIDPYHLVAGRADDRQVALWSRKLAIAAPLLQRALGVGDAERATRRFIDYLRNPDTLTYSTLFTVVATEA